MDMQPDQEMITEELVATINWVGTDLDSTIDNDIGDIGLAELASNEYYKFSKVPGMTYEAWSPWAYDSHPNNPDPSKPWTHYVKVTDADLNESSYWAVTFATEADANSYVIENPFYIFGPSTTLRVSTDDPSPADNRGGMSFLVHKYTINNSSPLVMLDG